MEILYSYISIIFVIFETIKLVFISDFWEYCLTQKNKWFKISDAIYGIFVFALIFGPYWLLAILLLILSIITHMNMFHRVKSKSELTKDVKKVLYFDGVLSIIILIAITIKGIWHL